MDWTKQIVRYVVIMLLQVLLFDQLQLMGICHPYIYVLCLLMMPITLPRISDMLIGAVVGLVMDIFCNSLGVHGLHPADVRASVSAECAGKRE